MYLLKRNLSLKWFLSNIRPNLKQFPAVIFSTGGRKRRGVKLSFCVFFKRIHNNSSNIADLLCPFDKYAFKLQNDLYKLFKKDHFHFKCFKCYCLGWEIPGWDLQTARKVRKHSVREWKHPGRVWQNPAGGPVSLPWPYSYYHSYYIYFYSFHSYALCQALSRSYAERDKYAGEMDKTREELERVQVETNNKGNLFSKCTGFSLISDKNWLWISDPMIRWPIYRN